MEIPLVIKKPEDKMAAKIVEENKKQIEALFPKDDQGNRVHTKDMETTKIILEDIHKKEHIPSLTNLTRKEIDAVRLARGMNMLAKNPLIANDIDYFLDLKRSETKEPTNMLKGVFDIATQYVGQTGNTLMRKMGLH